jgi:hypothetical protein
LGKGVEAMKGKWKLLKFVFAVLFLLPVCANATPIDVNIYGNTTISSGDYGAVNIYDTPPDQTTVIMTGGTAESIWAYNSSIFNIMQNGNVPWVVSAQDTSTILISGGSISSVQLVDSSIAHISGGSITGSLTTVGAATVHIYGKNFNFTLRYSNGPGWITGNWSDGSSFSIYYRNYEPFPGTHLFLHEIPEPCTLGLVGLGFFILRRNIKTFRK